MERVKETWRKEIPSRTRILQFDSDRDGFIPTTDLKRAVRESATFFGLSNDEVEELIRNVDQNNDHLVDFAEFCTLVS